MKKVIFLLCAISLLTAAGCSQQAEEASDAESPDAVVSVVDTEETTAETETTESIIDTVPTEPETAAQSETAETEILETIGEGELPASSEASEPTENTSETNGILLGTWEYPDGYRMRFLDGGEAELIMDYSSIMYIENDILFYHEDSYALIVEGNTVTAVNGDTEFLKMTAVDGTDAASLTGRFQLVGGEFYTMLSEGSGVYHIETTGSILRLTAQAVYQAADGVLTLSRDGSDVAVHYSIDGDVMTIVDDAGIKDTLTRVE